MTITQLRCFLTLTEYLNFTRAANSLFISQTTLSQHITKLEDELKVTLFERKKSGLVLTPEGQYLKSCARMVVRELDDLPQNLREIGTMNGVEEVPRIFNIGVDQIAFASDRLFTRRFINAIEELKQSYPRTEFIIRDVQPADMAQLLLDKNIDIAIGMIEKPEYDKLLTTALKEQPMSLILRYQPGWKKGVLPTMEDIRTALNGLEIHTVSFSPSHSLAIRRWLESEGCVKELKFENSGWMLQMKMSLENIVAIIPTHNISPEFDFANFYTVSIPDMVIPRYAAMNLENQNPLVGAILKRIVPPEGIQQDGE